MLAIEILFGAAAPMVTCSGKHLEEAASLFLYEL